MKLKIAMAGPSGTGKTTLSEYISKTYDIPFITTSTKPLWDKYQITSHQQLINKTIGDPNWGIQFQDEVLDFRINKLKGVDQFVTDRSPIDNLVYFLLQNCHLVSEKQTEDYAKRCRESMALFNGIICLPFTKEIPLENDGKRINNKYYQHVVNSTFQVAAQMMVKELQELMGDTMYFWDFEQRCKSADILITKIKEKDEGSSIS